MTQNRRAEVDQALEGVDFETTDYQSNSRRHWGPSPRSLARHCSRPLPNIIGLTSIGYYEGSFSTG
ncbi:MAG: hypothetical protein CM1200mP2_04480 [Planctomycetaceae bacterium]|nr:MAG: hypothetical protein CM1200mP2_04480 [Planctomycetaceae bacterium]